MAEGPLSKVARILAGVVLVQGRLGHQVLGQLLIADTNDAAIAAAAVVVAGTTRTRNAAAQVALRTAAPAIAVHALLQGEEQRIKRREQLLRDRESKLADRDTKLARLQDEHTRALDERAREASLHNTVVNEQTRLQKRVLALEHESARKDQQIAELHAGAERSAPKPRATRKKPAAAQRTKQPKGPRKKPGR